MKRIFFIIFTFSAFATLAQITKKDFEFVFKHQKYEDLRTISFSCLTNGSLSIYKTWGVKKEKETYELNDTSVYFTFYSDETKSKVLELIIIPYNRITFIKTDNNNQAITIAINN